MNRLRDLEALDLRALVESLASRAPSEHELSAENWLSVVELLTIRLQDGFGDLPVRFRSECSAAVSYALDTAIASGSIDRREGVIRRLNLSRALLRQVPPDTGVDILDPDRIIGLLLGELPMSVEEARALSADWRALDISLIRELRFAKNLLSPGLAISKLAAEGELDTRLRGWEEVFPMLP